MQSMKSVVAAVLVVAFTGCGISSNLKYGEQSQIDSQSAVLLLGVTPAYRIHLLRGDVENDVWTRPTVDVPEINMTPENGYIFVKIKPTTNQQRLGVSLVFPEGKAYGPCQDSIAPIFSLKPGSVNYVGELQYSYVGGKLTYGYTVEESKARSFLRANYPGMETLITTSPIVPMKVQTNRCNATATIPIFIPRGR